MTILKISNFNYRYFFKKERKKERKKEEGKKKHACLTGTNATLNFRSAIGA
jgi:hypothetical protein